MYHQRVEIITQSSVLARFGYALSDPTRSRVLLALREAPSYPGDLAEMAGVSKQSLSNHLTCLRGCGLVVAVPEGRRVRYELADRKLGDALTSLLEVVAVRDPECCCTTTSTHVDGMACCS
ncbi:MAG: transcriptional regulator [Micrococcaceae bacterium]|jgi:DNA-binding transcriptional ArsR family regulator|nr:transcriptional regulator [Micrococcaceae bacterium]